MRTKTPERAKYVAGKFFVIASLLDKAAADTDTETVQMMKRIRDNIHTGKLTRMNLSADVKVVQETLEKYLRLHVAHNGTS